MFTKEYFDKRFEGYSVPADIRAASERICSAYGINGSCDPMYIANVIAATTGRGDGKGKFTTLDRTFIDTSAPAFTAEGKEWFKVPHENYYVSFEHMEKTDDGWFYRLV